MRYAGSDLETFWLRLVMAVMASVQPELGRVITCRIWLPAFSVPFFHRRPKSYRAKPARIRSGWPGQGLAKRIWSRSKPVCTNHRARFWRNATGPLPVSHLQTGLRSTTDGLDHNYRLRSTTDGLDHNYRLRSTTDGLDHNYRLRSTTDGLDHNDCAKNSPDPI